MSTQEPKKEDYVLIENGDLDDAENVNTYSGHPNLSDYVVAEGMLEPHDIGGGTFDITAGKWFVMLETQVAERDNELRHKSLLTGYIYERTGQRLADPSVDNFVYMDPHLGTDDSPLIHVRTQNNLDNDSEEPKDEWLHIATIHPDGNWTPKNRAPDAVFDHIEATIVDADQGDFETIEVEKIIYPDGEQTEAGIQIGDRIDNPNDYYDAVSTSGDGEAPPGVVHASVYADYARNVQAGGKVPGEALVGPINIKNERYEDNGDGKPVDNASWSENSKALQGRDVKSIMYENAIKQPQVLLPRAKIQSGTPSGIIVEVNGENFKLWSHTLSTPNDESRGDIRFRIRAGDGTILYEADRKREEGDYLQKDPLFEVSSRSRIHLELYHENGNKTEASAQAGWTIE